MITIKKKNSGSLTHVKWLFPDGAVGVRLDTDNLKFLWDPSPTIIVARIQSSEDIMELVMITDALRRWSPASEIRLVMPCVAYQRQDRACTRGEAHSLKAFATLINGLGFAEVKCLDPHSDVLGACFDRFQFIDQATIIGRFNELNRAILNDPAKTIFVSPDAGANKKVSELAKLYGHERFVRADKLRDMATGKILETVVYGGVDGLICVIADDLIDRGGTFMALAKALKDKGAAQVLLFCTHGLFTGPIAPLFEAGICQIYTTNSYRTDVPAHPELKVLDICELAC